MSGRHFYPEIPSSTAASKRRRRPLICLNGEGIDKITIAPENAGDIFISVQAKDVLAPADSTASRTGLDAAVREFIADLNRIDPISRIHPHFRNARAGLELIVRKTVPSIAAEDACLRRLLRERQRDGPQEQYTNQ
jgi:hypothetical protein